MNSECITRISGTAVPLRGDDIDTDRIIPARFLRCVTFDGLGAHSFEDDRRQNPDHAFNQKRYQGAAVLVCERNFGCGSSREHAPQALRRWGIQALVGQSFAEIFFGNCCNLGMPCFLVSDADSEKLLAAVEVDPTLELELNVADGTVKAGSLLIRANLPAGPKRAFLEGTWNATRVLLEAAPAIERVASELPYVNGFAG